MSVQDLITDIGRFVVAFGLICFGITFPTAILFLSHFAVKMGKSILAYFTPKEEEEPPPMPYFYSSPPKLKAPASPPVIVVVALQIFGFFLLFVLSLFLGIVFYILWKR